MNIYPCELISHLIKLHANVCCCLKVVVTISFHDELEFMEPAIEKKLNLSNIQGENETPYVFTDNREELMERAKTGMANERQCRITGTLNLPKVHV